MPNVLKVLPQTLSSKIVELLVSHSGHVCLEKLPSTQCIVQEVLRNHGREAKSNNTLIRM